MPISLSLAERILVRLGVIPAPLVDFTQHAAFRLLLVGYRLGVFEALDDRALPPDDLARRLGVHRDGLEPLLHLLRRLGYLSLHAGRYANTRAATRWLTRRSPHSLTPLADFLEDHVRRWDYLEETVRRGDPPTTAYHWYDAHPDRWPSFHEGQRTIATLTTDEVARAVRLRAGPLRLLDVGGSHGLYTIALCRRYPEMQATIYDWPQGVVAAQKEIARAGMEGRIGTQTGDFLTDDLGTGYDVALLGNILHGHKPDTNLRLLSRLHAALTIGGTLLIVDQVRLRQPFTRYAGYVAELTGLLLRNELGGALYPYPLVRDWLRRTGYHDVRLRRLLRAPGNVLIQASCEL